VLQLWFMNSRMMLNPNKSEAMICGTWQRRSRSQLQPSIKVAGADIAVVDHIRLLGVTVDNMFTWRKHVQEVCKSFNFHLHALFPLTSPTWSPAVATRLDYCNALLYGAGERLKDKLQWVQNPLVHLVCNNGRDFHSHDLLRRLHWLPVRQRIKHKVASLTSQGQSFRSAGVLGVTAPRLPAQPYTEVIDAGPAGRASHQN
jgi:hypothetical protein